MRKRRSSPIDRAYENGNDTGSTGAVQLQRLLHFSPVTVIRVDEIRTDQQEDNVSCVEMLRYFVLPFSSVYWLLRISVPKSASQMTLAGTFPLHLYIKLMTIQLFTALF